MGLTIILLFQKHSLIKKIEESISESERERLHSISVNNKLYSTLLPIKSVGVQVSFVDLIY